MANEIFDYEELMERVQDDKELLSELLELYIEDFKQKRGSLDEYVKNQDFENIRGVAHSLKGASGNISAKALREILLELEQKGKDETMEGVEDLLNQLDKGFEELNSHLAEIKDKLQES